MGEQMTVKQVLEATMEMIGRINVPVLLKEQIADPLGHARNNLALCVEAIERSEQTESEMQRNGGDSPPGSGGDVTGGQFPCSEPEVQIEEVGG